MSYISSPCSKCHGFRKIPDDERGFSFPCMHCNQTGFEPSPPNSTVAETREPDTRNNTVRANSGGKIKKNN